MPQQINIIHHLFSEFPPQKKSEWEEIVKRDLKSDDFKSKLVWNLPGGFSAFPYFTREDLDHSATCPVRQSANWKICEHIFDENPAEANKSIKKAIKGGAEACLIQLENNSGSYTQIRSQADYDLLTEGIDQHGIELIFDCGSPTPAISTMVQKQPVSQFKSTLFFDPFAFPSRHDHSLLSEFNLASTVREILENGHSKLCANGSFYHHAGVSIPQELGTALAIAGEYLAQTEQKNRPHISNSIFVKLAAGPLYFPEIAKFRAMRILWQNLLEAFKLDKTIPAVIFTETTRRNKTGADPYGNLLRTVTEAMAAITGGADVVMVNPFGKPDNFSIRMARNIQLILREEAYFDKVADPPAGSYYIKQLTQTIAEESWTYFQQIEQKGGFLQALKKGFIQEAR